MSPPLNTDNNQSVGVRGDEVVILLPQQVMSKSEALRHAAWLVALADDDDEFPAVLTAVRST